MTGSVSGDRVSGTIIGENTGTIKKTYCDLTGDIIGKNGGEAQNVQQLNTRDMRRYSSLINYLSDLWSEGVEIMPGFDSEKVWSFSRENYPTLQDMDTEEQINNRR